MGFADVVADALMAAGVIAMLRARHTHPHAHPAIEHEYAHVHDEHHRGIPITLTAAVRFPIGIATSRCFILMFTSPTRIIATAITRLT
ncbi:MAG: hypothetical protein ACREQN_12690 [Candidatus Binataceae bacterium]